MRLIPRQALILLSLSGAFTCAAVAQENASPFPRLYGESQDGGFIDIPGVGRMPLGPGGERFAAPRALPKSVAPARPEPPKTPEQKQAAEMERLFARLAAASDAREAETAAVAIQRRWAQSGSDTLDLLMARAVLAESLGAQEVSRALMDSIIVLSPDWSEVFVRRGSLLVGQGDATAALADFERAARLEPRRFDALEAIGALAEKSGDKKRALDAYGKALALSPQNEAVRARRERLRIETEGRDI